MSTSADSGWGSRVVAMATIAAVGVSVIYLPQPIQTLAARDLGVPLELSSGPSVAVQAGYAIGILLLVSLGDRMNPRRQVTSQLVTTAAAILVAALSPSFVLFVAMMFVAGATATVGQILVSAALRLAPPAARARTAAILIGSFLIGLFSVRTTLGLLAESLGWRTVLIGAAVVVLACIPLALRFAPTPATATPVSYRRLFSSIPGMVGRSRPLRLLTLTHALAFSAFIGAWSTITVFGVAELGLSVAQTSAIGLAGLAGGAATMSSASAQTRIGTRRALPWSLGALVLGAAALAIAPTVIPVLVVGLFLVSFGMSSSQVSSQADALASVDSMESGRANTVFMATTFFASSAATALAGLLMSTWGYSAVGALALALSLGSLAVALVAARQQ